ncbi:MAG: YqaA family protein [Longimicrobiales bacterium]
MTDPAKPDVAPEPVVDRPGPVRRLYDWVLSWADRPQGPAALFCLAFAESSFFPIPPDPLLVALALGRPPRALYFALICSLGSVLGGMLGYALGWAFWEALSDFFFAYVPGFSEEAFARVGDLYQEYDFMAVFLAGFTPLPYKVFTIAGGVFQISFPVFVLASGLSRSARFFLVAGLIFFFGPGIQDFIDRYFDKLAWAFLILIVLGFLAIKYML